MQKSTYPIISGIIFAIVALLQLLRAIEQWPVQIASFAAPVWISWLAAIVTGGLSLWAFRSRE
ncbi:MAG: hypothetical protein M3Y27_10030 [Acidobacteriota bacterium]|nr:hypothetical protein [Acidobacteriota bacterium]